MIYQYSTGQFMPQPGQGRTTAAQRPHQQTVASSFLPPSVAAAASVPTDKHAANGMTSCNSQAGIPPAGSPAIQIRGSRGQQSIPKGAEPQGQPAFLNALRSLPTPARGGAARGGRGEDWQPWGTDCAAFLAAEGDEGRYRGRARFLDLQTITSMKEALDGLNRRIIWCPEDLCVVYAAAERAYYMLYRRGRFDSALGQLGVTREELAAAAPAPATAGAVAAAMSTCSEGRPSLCEISEQVSIIGRPSLSEGGPGGPSKVTRQTSMPSRSVAPPSRRPCLADKGASETTQPAPRVAAPVLEERPNDGPSARPHWMQPPNRSYATPASTPGVPPPAATSTPGVPPVAVTPGVPPPGAHTPGAPPQVGPATYFAIPGPQRGHCTPIQTPLQSFVPVPGAHAAACSAVAQPQLTARAPSRANIPKVAGQRVAGPEPRTSNPPVPRALAVVPPTRQGPVAVVSAMPVAAAMPVAGASEDNGPVEKQHEALGRDLTEGEKVNFSDLNFVENLGSGEFGQVFRGFYRGEEVAIKQLYWDDTFTDGVLQDLAKEIESFRHLRHKRLVKFIGACLQMPHPTLVTQYMPGGSLHHLLHARKIKLPSLHATNMCLQLSDGVLYLHSQTPTVVHRDLKSLNVVLDLNLNIKICDFGLTESMERTHITKRNNGGSPRYMAPELFDSKTKITEKIDIWAMGCIFVEIFGGPLPYESINTLADLTREMLVHRRSPDVPEYIFDELATIIRSMLVFDHRMRLTSKQTFEQLKAAKRILRHAGKLEGHGESRCE